MTVPVDAEDASGRSPAAGLDAPDDPGTRPEPARLDAPDDQGIRLRPARSTQEAVAGICPYLTSSGGSWRVVTPSRDHRCAAVDPPAAQPTDKQRRHCLSDDHISCPVFVAARDARSATLAAGADPALVDAADRRRRPLARTAPVLLEPPRLLDQAAVRLQFERGPGQLALIGLMVVAFAIVALTRLSTGGGAVPSASPSQVAAAVSPSPRPTPTATPSAGPSASSESPAPSAQVTYKVRKGDTLQTIARKFNTTAAKIKTLNGLKSSTLKVGQVLKIP